MQNRLNEEFINYQQLSHDKSANLSEEDPVDMLWGYLRGVKKLGTSELAFGLLFSVAEVVMYIPHSNAGEERNFSFVNKNQRPSGSSLKLEGTLYKQQNLNGQYFWA